MVILILKLKITYNLLLEEKNCNRQIYIKRTNLYVPLFYQGLDEHLRAQGDRFDCVLALEPTGWACNKKFTTLAELKPKLKRDRITLYGMYL